MFTFEQNIQMENYKAQHNTVLGNIKDATKKLESTLKEVKSSQLLLDDLKKSIDKSKEELHHTLSAKNMSLAELKNARDDLANLFIERSAITLELNSAKEKFSKTISFLKDEYQSLLVGIKQIRSDYLKFEDRLLEQKSLLDKERQLILTLEQQIKEKSSELYNLNKERLQFLNITSKEKKELTSSLQSLKEETRKEKIKISRPAQFLYDKEEEIQKKEKNLEILKLRLQKYFDQFFPGQNVKL